MTNSLDNNIYKAIWQDKKLTEIYLGNQEFEWYYSKAKYSATCTEAIEFTLFDKTICGLLQVEEHLGLEQIGEILGFNVIDSPIENKYRDVAEYEILKEALQSLQEYEMIDGGDIDFSYCTLTDIGREYVAKGKKFKIHENKVFELYFDNTSGEHEKAKENFEFIRGENAVNDVNTFEYEDEVFLKSFAQNQIPEIYNPDNLNSFKDATCLNKSHYKTILNIVFLFNVSNGKIKVLVFDETTGSINDYFTEYIIKNKSDFNSFISSNYQIQPFDNTENKLVGNLIKFQDKIELSSEDESQENVLKAIEEYYNNSEFIEPVKFFNEIDNFMNISGDEIWLLLKEICANEIEVIKKSTKKHPDKSFFIYLEANEANELLTQAFKNESKKYSNVYILLVDLVEEFNIIFKENICNGWNVFKLEKSIIPITINDKMSQFEKEFIQRNVTDIDLEENYLSKFRNSFAKEYVPIIDKNITEYFDKSGFEEVTNKNVIEEIRDIDKRLLPFKQLGNSKKYFEKLDKQKQQYVDAILSNRKVKIDVEIEKISKKFTGRKDPTIDFIEKIEGQLKREKEKCLEEEQRIFANIETKLKATKKDIEIASKRKSIIIDTNILLEEPNIIEIIGQHQTIVFSGKVIDELDSLKMKPELKLKAQNAIRSIHKHQQDKNIRFNTSKIDNLPGDFNRKSPDNIILSVAVQYLKRNPILLTNDKGMNIKAKILDIPAKTIKELETILTLSQVAFSNKGKKKAK